MDKVSHLPEALPIKVIRSFYHTLIKALLNISQNESDIKSRTYVFFSILGKYYQPLNIMSLIPSISEGYDYNDKKSSSQDFSKSFDCAMEWKLFCDGSESAFVKIYNHYFQSLYNLGRQFSGDTDLLKDCLQETFISIRKKRHDLHKVISVKAFLIKCYRNKIITEQKKQKKKNKKMDFDLSNESFGFLVTPSHESLLVNKQFHTEQVALIQDSLNKLTQRQREVIYYFYYNGLSYSQIKEVMGFSSVRAVRNLMYRSLSELKKYAEAPVK